MAAPTTTRTHARPGGRALTSERLALSDRMLQTPPSPNDCVHLPGRLQGISSPGKIVMSARSSAMRGSARRSSGRRQWTVALPSSVSQSIQAGVGQLNGAGIPGLFGNQAQQRPGTLTVPLDFQGNRMTQDRSDVLFSEFSTFHAQQRKFALEPAYPKAVVHSQ